MHQENKKIGILGGTFNPVHQGHIALGMAAYQQYQLDEIWFMVAKIPPHKREQRIPSAQIRLEMVKLALREIPYMHGSDFEMKKEGYSYTAETLELLQQEYPADTFYFIIGGDSLHTFMNWYQPEQILKRAIILASQRDEMEEEALDDAIRHVKEAVPGSDIRKIEFQKIPFSSTEIREKIANGVSVEEMTGREVYQYIKEHHLYEKG